MDQTAKVSLMIKVQVAVALAAIAVTIAAALSLNSLVSARETLRTEVAALERQKATLMEEKQQAEEGVRAALEKLNAEQATPSQLSPRARATPVSGIKDPKGRQVYDFILSIDASPATASRIDKVVYAFNHPTFLNKKQESRDAPTGFAVSYRGWGCLYVVDIEVVFKNGKSQTHYFDMCAALAAAEPDEPVAGK